MTTSTTTTFRIGRHGLPILDPPSQATARKLIRRDEDEHQRQLDQRSEQIINEQERTRRQRPRPHFPGPLTEVVKQAAAVAPTASTPTPKTNKADDAKILEAHTVGKYIGAVTEAAVLSTFNYREVF